MLETLLSLWLIFGANNQSDSILSESTQPVELQSQNKAENKDGVRWDKERRNCRSLGNNRYKCEIDVTGTGMGLVNQAYEPKGIQNISHTNRLRDGIGSFGNELDDIHNYSWFYKPSFHPDYRDHEFSLGARQKLDGQWYTFKDIYRVILDGQERNPDSFIYFLVGYTYDFEDDDQYHQKYDRAIEVLVFTKQNLRPIKPGFSAMTLHNPIRISRAVPFLNDHSHGFALWPKKLRLMHSGAFSRFVHQPFFLLALESLLIATEAQNNDNMEIVDMSFEPEIKEYIHNGRMHYRYIDKHILSVEFIKR
ncbi:hypothetical protein PN466_23935 [Roseofilum reptotaenium CS-1145]|uniref:Uncharacterized protein n=1 Tax=Roseofilum reptotaenium AO1-A TaxID=1925591 RepID=A0A1L9QY48_9CYAN|nr:hypothetical protein [Roseofilum reptotaenium]MDB9520001.1 hypothetical protein [Roseofilum reptotaenium CS-1145]OJJ27611.1 hypothetical protein BI308_01205 [Roseofilum reptotaenium AO1-A]